MNNFEMLINCKHFFCSEFLAIIGVDIFRFLFWFKFNENSVSCFFFVEQHPKFSLLFQSKKINVTNLSLSLF